MKRAFFLVSKVVTIRLTKQTSKNAVDTTFKCSICRFSILAQKSRYQENYGNLGTNIWVYFLKGYHGAVPL